MRQELLKRRSIHLPRFGFVEPCGGSALNASVNRRSAHAKLVREQVERPGQFPRGEPEENEDVLRTQHRPQFSDFSFYIPDFEIWNKRRSSSWLHPGRIRRQRLRDLSDIAEDGKAVAEAGGDEELAVSLVIELMAPSCQGRLERRPPRLRQAGIGAKLAISLAITAVAGR